MRSSAARASHLSSPPHANELQLSAAEPFPLCCALLFLLLILLVLVMVTRVLYANECVVLSLCHDDLLVLLVLETETAQPDILDLILHETGG